MAQLNRLHWQQTLLARFSCHILLVLGIFLAHNTITLAHSSQVKLSNPSFSKYLAQTNPLYGCWRLTYSSFGVVHESLLQMNGYDGVMVTGFYDSSVRDTVFVRQYMKMKGSARGLLILGYNPVYVGSNRRANYSPDNFLFQVNPNGDFLAGTCDDEGKCSPVEVGACPQ
jgi:hypothetical protein